MNEARVFDSHLDAARLWQWRDGALTEVESSEIRSHLEKCASCRQRAAALERVVKLMQDDHRAAQPTLAEQMHLVRALENQFSPEAMPNVLVNTSRRLLRWLVPAVAVLAMLLMLLRSEPSTSSKSLVNVLPETAESRLLLVSSDEQLQAAMWELALSDDQNQK
jgi:anti-sigma factor RsiW